MLIAFVVIISTTNLVLKLSQFINSFNKFILFKCLDEHLNTNNRSDWDLSEIRNSCFSKGAVIRQLWLAFYFFLKIEVRVTILTI